MGGGDEGLRRTMKSGDGGGGGGGGNGHCTASRRECGRWTASRTEQDREDSRGEKGEREGGPNDEKNTDQQKQNTHRNT